jgi:hypothetical protein
VVAITGFAFFAATVVLLQLPLSATAGIAYGDRDRGVAQFPSSPAAPSRTAPATYQLRCWQYGRLLFDEGPVTLGAEARQGAKLVAIDRNGAPLIVTDAGGTTCLARSFAAVRSLALPQ